MASLPNQVGEPQDAVFSRQSELAEGYYAFLHLYLATSLLEHHVSGERTICCSRSAMFQLTSYGLKYLSTITNILASIFNRKATTMH